MMMTQLPDDPKYTTPEVVVNGQKPPKKDYALSDLYRQRLSGQYFCGAQARVFMNALELDEIVEIEGVYQLDQIPIYGYASTHFDTVAHGKAIVNGMFTINYKYDGYLWANIKAAKAGKKSPLKEKLKNGTPVNAVVNSTQGATNNFGTEKDPKTGVTNVTTWPDDSLESLIYGNLTDEAIVSLQAEYWGDKNKVIKQNDPMANPNGIRPEFIGPISIEIRDFRLGYDSTEYEVKTLHNVFINRYSTMRRSDGSPVVEVYTFIAQTFI